MNKFNIIRFPYYPYLKTSLSECKFPIHLIYDFKKSYNNLPFDPYITNKTRQRRYSNYHIKNIDDKQFDIQHTEKTTFKQDVTDSRKEERVFELLKNPSDPFLMHFLMMASQLVNINHPIKELSIDVHQVRQRCYPDLESHNSAEGIHQDGCDYVIPACIINRHNINGGYSSVYNNDKKLLKTFLLKENEFVFQDDRKLYHYVTPIQYKFNDSLYYLSI